jgi:branched-chain amino acid transport system permease protein
LGIPYGTSMPNVRIGPFELPSGYRIQGFYYIALAFAAAFLLMTSNIFRTRIGRAFVAVRDNENVAKLIGIDTFRYKLLSFAISSFYAGFAGALLAYYMVILVPGYFTIQVTVEYIVMILLGGLASIWGPVIGAASVELLSEVLRMATGALTPIVGLTYASSILEPMKLVIYSAIIITIVILEPYGMMSLFRKFRATPQPRR